MDFYVLFKLCLADVLPLCRMPVVYAWLSCCCAAGIISLQMSAALSKADLTVSHTGLDAAAFFCNYTDVSYGRRRESAQK